MIGSRYKLATEYTTNSVVYVYYYDNRKHDYYSEKTILENNEPLFIENSALIKQSVGVSMSMFNDTYNQSYRYAYIDGDVVTVAEYTTQQQAIMMTDLYNKGHVDVKRIATTIFSGDLPKIEAHH